MEKTKNELSLFTFMTDDPGGWHGRIWRRGLRALQLPDDTHILIVDNTHEAPLTSAAFEDLPFDVTIVQHEAPYQGSNGDQFFCDLWAVALAALPSSQYVMSLDWDVLPIATYADLRTVMSESERTGAVALKTRSRHSGHLLTAFPLTAINPYNLNFSLLPPSDVTIPLGRTNTCCVLFRREALDKHRPRRVFVQGHSQFEHALWADLWQNDYQLLLAGGLPWCRHYLNETEYVADTVKVQTEDTHG